MVIATTINATAARRKRSRSLVGLSLALAALCVEPSTAFSNPPVIVSSVSKHIIPSLQSTVAPPLPTSALRMVSSSVLREVVDHDDGSARGRHDSIASAPPRLSLEEEKELLRQAVELRRLKNLETELALRSNNATPLLSIRSKEAGYGEDIVAYEQALLDGEMAREQLITTNMGLVYYCVNEIIGNKSRGTSTRRLNSLSRDDLLQEGAIGLARAIDRWNPAIGGKFSTYAVYWVRAAILRCIAEKDDILRVPEHVSAAVRKMSRGAQKLGLDVDGDSLLSTVYASDASWKEALAAKALAEEAGLTDRQLAEALRIRSRRNAGGYVAFESWMQKGKDIQSDVSTLATREEALRPVQVEQLKKTLGRYLRPKEMEALFWRYGLLDESSADQEQPAAPSNKPKQPKNYLAIAEEELYGKPADKKTKQKKATKAKKSSSRATKAAEIPVRGKWGEAMSFVEVGKRMEVSAEYGRRLCHAALKKLRQAADDGLLEPALLC
ncbi:sigma factor SigA [Seminavis robusta]|uniref:Sigma factor SigA n=1 Tax=Seminavis robusta TaxID=568900 RepID=A0A9N8ERY2_9STRA|nr:sigma factor SigA [Seminavis robusta]|eukprot:Sro1926_g305920.1 sigma factor SigA (497) ;mRNA; r:15139-16629